MRHDEGVIACAGGLRQRVLRHHVIARRVAHDDALLVDGQDLPDGTGAKLSLAQFSGGHSRLLR